MSHSLEIKIQLVILMAKYESPVMVIRESQHRRTTNIAERHAITSIDSKSARLKTVLIQEDLQQ